MTRAKTNRPKTRAGTSSDKDKKRPNTPVPFDQLEDAIDALDQPADKPKRKGPPPPPPKKSPAKSGLDSLLPDDPEPEKPKKRAATEKPKASSLDTVIDSMEQSYPSPATRPARAPSVEIDMSDVGAEPPPLSPAEIADAAIKASSPHLQAPDDSYPPLVGPEPLKVEPTASRRTPVPPPKRSFGPDIVTPPPVLVRPTASQDESRKRPADAYADREVDPWLRKREAAGAADDPSADPWLKKREAVEADDVDPWLRKREAVDASDDPSADPWLRKREAVDASDDPSSDPWLRKRAAEGGDEDPAADPWRRKREAVEGADEDPAADPWLRKRDAAEGSDDDDPWLRKREVAGSADRGMRESPQAEGSRESSSSAQAGARVRSSAPLHEASSHADGVRKGSTSVPPTAVEEHMPLRVGLAEAKPLSLGLAEAKPLSLGLADSQGDVPEVSSAHAGTRESPGVSREGSSNAGFGRESPASASAAVATPQPPAPKPGTPRTVPPRPAPKPGEVRVTSAQRVVGPQVVVSPRATGAQRLVGPPVERVDPSASEKSAPIEKKRQPPVPPKPEPRSIVADAAKASDGPVLTNVLTNVITDREGGDARQVAGPADAVRRVDPPRSSDFAPISTGVLTNLLEDLEASDVRVDPSERVVDPRMAGAQRAVDPKASAEARPRIAGAKRVVEAKPGDDSRVASAAQPRMTGAQRVVDPKASAEAQPRMTGAQRVVEPKPADDSRAASGAQPRMTGAQPRMTGAQRVVEPKPADDSRAASGAQPRMTGGQRVVDPKVASGAQPRMTGAQPVVDSKAASGAQPRMTGAQPVVDSKVSSGAQPRMAQPVGGVDDPRTPRPIGVPKTIPPPIAVPKSLPPDARESRLGPPKAPGVGWARDAFDEEALADAERAAASGLIEPPREELPVEPPRPRRVDATQALGVGWARDADQSEVFADAKRAEQSGLLRLDELKPPPRAQDSAGEAPPSATREAREPRRTTDDEMAAMPREQREAMIRELRDARDSATSGSMPRAQRPSEPPPVRDARAQRPSEAPPMRGDEPRAQRPSEAPPARPRVQLPSEMLPTRDARAHRPSEAPPLRMQLPSEALPTRDARAQRPSEAPPPRPQRPSEAPPIRAQPPSEPPPRRAQRPSEVPPLRMQLPSEALPTRDARARRPSEVPPLRVQRPSEAPDGARPAPPRPPPGSPRREIGVDEGIVVEHHELPPVRTLAIAVHDAAANLGATTGAIRLAGHDVAASATGPTGIEQIKTLLRAGSVDALLVGIPGGEVLVETAFALAPARPVVIAACDGNAVEVVRRAGSVGADLVVARPVDIERLAPVLLAASRLSEERRTATSAKGSETILRARLDALVEPEPGALQPFELFQRVLELELKRSRRYGYPIAVALFAVDLAVEPPPGVRGILRARAGNALIRSIRDIDMATEVDQERFLVLLPYTSLTGAAEVARRIIGAVASGEPVHANGKLFAPKLVGAVAGAIQGQPLSFARLMRDATQALEQARRDGAELAVPMTRPPEDA